MKGLIIEPEDCDVFVIHLPDNTYVAIFPWPLCTCQHKTAEEAAQCAKVQERLEEDKRNARFSRGNGGYL